MLKQKKRSCTCQKARSPFDPMNRNATMPSSIHAEGSSSSVGCSHSTMNSITGRPPFLFTSAKGPSGRQFHAAALAAKPPKVGPPDIASQSLSSTLGLFPRAGTSPLQNAPSLKHHRTASASSVAPESSKAGDDGVKIKTRDSTNFSRRAAVKQSCSYSPGTRIKAGTESFFRSSDTLESDVQPLRASSRRPDFFVSRFEDTDGRLHSSDQGSNGHSANIQPPSRRLVASQIIQQHLSPISEVANASISSGSFSHDIEVEAYGGDGSNIRDSALYTFSPLVSQRSSQSHADIYGNHSTSKLPLEILSPVQRQASPIFDAHRGDTLIQNMHEMLADPAPMQVHNFYSFFRLH
jgi:hypothetical protein